MRKWSIIIAAFVSLGIFAGCSNSDNGDGGGDVGGGDAGGTSFAEKSFDEGRIALASKEYEKARGLFRLSLSEDPENAEMQDYYNLSFNCTELKKSIDNQDFEKEMELIEKIDKNSKKEIVMDDFQDIKEQFKGKKDELQLKKDIEKAQKRIAEFTDIHTEFKEKKIVDENSEEYLRKVKELFGREFLCFNCGNSKVKYYVDNKNFDLFKIEKEKVYYLLN